MSDIEYESSEAWGGEESPRSSEKLVGMRAASPFEEGEIRRDGRVEEEQVPFKIRTLTVESLRLRILQQEGEQPLLSISGDHTLPLTQFKEYLEEVCEESENQTEEDQTEQLEKDREDEFQNIQVMALATGLLIFSTILFGWYLAVGAGAMSRNC